MKKKLKNLPVQVKDFLCRGFYVIFQSKEIIVIGNCKQRRKIFDLARMEFVFEWTVDVEAIRNSEKVECKR